MQPRLKNQIHAIMHRHGIVHDYADLFGMQPAVVPGVRQLVDLIREIGVNPTN